MGDGVRGIPHGPPRPEEKEKAAAGLALEEELAQKRQI